MSKCTDCNGSGRYQPLIGPSEPCRACSGNIITGIWKTLTMATKAHAGVPAGHWYIWDEDWMKPIAIWVKPVVQVSKIRLMAVDARDQSHLTRVERKKKMLKVFHDERPAEYNGLKAEVRAALGSGHYPEIFIGPEVELTVDGHHAFWHIYTKLGKNEFVDNMLPHIYKGGPAFELSSEHVKLKVHDFYAPRIRAI